MVNKVDGQFGGRRNQPPQQQQTTTTMTTPSKMLHKQPGEPDKYECRSFNAARERILVFALGYWALLAPRATRRAPPQLYPTKEDVQMMRVTVAGFRAEEVVLGQIKIAVQGSGLSPVAFSLWPLGLPGSSPPGWFLVPRLVPTIIHENRGPWGEGLGRGGEGGRISSCLRTAQCSLLAARRGAKLENLQSCATRDPSMSTACSVHHRSSFILHSPMRHHPWVRETEVGINSLST